MGQECLIKVWQPDSGYGTVDEIVVSCPRDPQIESSLWQFMVN